jgi:hypothetical protein
MKKDSHQNKLSLLRKLEALIWKPLPVGQPPVELNVSLIVPCWTAESDIAPRLQAWAAYPGVRELLLSVTETCRVPRILATHPTIRVIRSPQANRGMQMNRAGQQACGDILMFHHLDSSLHLTHIQSVLHALGHEARLIGGAFFRHFDHRHPRLRFLEDLERLHSLAFGTLYGDQTLFVRRTTFANMGGMAEIPLMEDVEFSGRLRRSGRLLVLDPPMKTSPRRHLQRGPWRVTLQNIRLLLAYRMGVDPHQLHRSYYSPNPVKVS